MPGPVRTMAGGGTQGTLLPQGLRLMTQVFEDRGLGPLAGTRSTSVPVGTCCCRANVYGMYSVSVYVISFYNMEMS
ncbi:hypothetical protein E2C01_101822 [Portunus trituberculatus]|uniref:Uncharacterized protein n=1 Tax=Portunus trituberculatus TaxID=210409 RepID=A0A5B7KBM3_PORTR|nr:hypothetical protein [Portunus trituberculatus]